MEKKLKVYELNIDSNGVIDGIDFISLVERPAVEYNFLTFNDQKNITQKYAIDVEDERIVLGVVMLADVPIYRINDVFGEHYIVFTKNEIKKILLKYFKEDKSGNVNLDHNPNRIINNKGAFLFQAYIVNRNLGINPPTAFKDVTDGSIIGAFKIEDNQIWSDIKSGEFKGFSIEGIFEYGRVVGHKFEKETKEDDEMVEYMHQIYKDLSKLK